MIPQKDFGEFIVDMASISIVALIYIIYYSYTKRAEKGLQK